MYIYAWGSALRVLLPAAMNWAISDVLSLCGFDALVLEWLLSSLAPGPTRKGAPVALANRLICAESENLCTLCHYMVASYCWWWYYRENEQILCLWSDYRQILWGKSSSLASINTLYKSFWNLRFTESLLAYSYHFQMVLEWVFLCQKFSCDSSTPNEDCMLMHTAHMEIFAGLTRPISWFQMWPGDNANFFTHNGLCSQKSYLHFFFIRDKKLHNLADLLLFQCCNTRKVLPSLSAGVSLPHVVSSVLF